MEKIQEIVQNIIASVQYIADAVIYLLFQPIVVLLQVIEGIMNIWTPAEEEENSDYPEQVHVKGFGNNEQEK